MGTEIVRCDFTQEAPAPDGKQLAFEDRSPHCPCTVGHGCGDEPLLAELAETPGFKETPVLALLLDAGRTTLTYGASRIDTFLASSCERQPGWAVLPENDSLAPAMQTVVKPERQRTSGRHEHVHAVTVGDFVRFFFWSQWFKCPICQQRLTLQANTVGHFLSRDWPDISLLYRHLGKEKYRQTQPRA
jgi:hypothetical protein